MFVMDPAPTFGATITVSRPAEAGHVEDVFRASFKVLGDTAIATYDFDDLAKSKAFLRDVLLGFSEVQAADGQPLPFTEANRDALIDLPYVRLALVKGYFDTLYKASSGN